jgi:glycyl-tRNA synthetase beta chain
MTDFLLELRSEEIPARMQAKAKDDLARLFGEALARAGLAADSIETFATPRRLALIAKGLPLETEAVSEETKGPKVGAPPQAIEGFLRKVGLSEDQLVERDGIYFAVIEKPGRKTADVLAEAIPAIIRAFPWPKSQRWGAASASTESLRWVRPLQGIVALLGDDVVPCEIDGIVSGRITMGHRFHSSGPVEIANAGAFVETLRAAHVIVHFSERCAIIRDGAQSAAKAAGLVLVEDEGLVAENAGLTEWPVPMLGRFDPAFLAVPQEVIQLTARVNQKYFVCHDANGKLANAFVCTANIVANDGGAAIVAGNEKVLAARLSDAKFFWEQDLKVLLEDQAKKLAQITFHEKLGTVADKVERVAKLARWLVEEGVVKSSPSLLGEGDRPKGDGGAASTAGALASAAPPSAANATATSPSELGEDLADQAERAARLCKADLVTGMVGEFPELQGIMGGYYARAQGEPDAVADAVRDHYKPVGQGDDVPTAPVTVAVSLADKLDTLAGFFIVKERPTGSKDPFALRRAGISIASLILTNGIRLPLANAIMQTMFGVLEGIYGARIMGTFNEITPTLARLSDPDIASAVFNDVFPRVELPEDPAALVPVKQSDRENAVALIEILAFLFDRLKVQQREAGVRHDLIDAVFALGGEDDLVRLLARVKALQAFVATQEGADLLAGYKRAANILKADTSDKNNRHPELVSGSIVPNEPMGKADKWMLKQVQHDDLEDAERALLTALDTAEPKAETAIEAEDFEGAMAALAGLRGPIDAFFDKETGVMVNDPDPEKRAYRLGLLARFRDAVHRVADFSRIEG